MSRVSRPHPRRPARLYPVGTQVTLRDGRTFVVAQDRERYWDDPTLGHGGGSWEWRNTPRYWVVVA